MIVEHLSFAYRPGRPVLRDVSFRVDRGEAVAVLGANGSGKSTLLLCLLHLVRKFSGNVEVLGVKVTKESAPNVRKRVGLLFQDSNDQLFLPLVTDELAFGPYNLGLKGGALREAVSAAANELELREFLERKTFQLSHGERKRVAFGTIHAMSPEVYLLDEPTANLDPRNRDTFHAALRALHERGKTLVMVSHELDHLPEFFDRALVLDSGVVAFDGPVGELYRRPETLKAANLKVPLLAWLFEGLKKRGVLPGDAPVPTSVEEAADLLASLRGLTGRP
ncbi:MAG: ATP-binding cassette domain-containing protein [Promethearchaeota archaeon]